PYYPVSHSFPTRRSSDLKEGSNAGRSGRGKRSYAPNDRAHAANQSYAKPIQQQAGWHLQQRVSPTVSTQQVTKRDRGDPERPVRSEEHTSELQSPDHLVC